MSTTRSGTYPGTFPDMKRLAVVLLLLFAACGGDDGTISHEDADADCRSAFGEGLVECGDGADIISVGIDAIGPVVLTIEMSETPHFNTDFQWLVEFSISDLACGLTNTETTDEGIAGSDLIGPYGYRILTNEDAPLGTCEGSLDGTTATLIFNIQPPLGPWTISGGTQYVEIENLQDDGSSDDVEIDMTPEG